MNSLILLLVVLTVIAVVVGLSLGLYLRRRAGEADFPAPSIGGPRETRETQVLLGWLLTQAFEQTGIKVSDDRVAVDRLTEAARQAVDELHTQASTTISLPFLTADENGPKHFEIRVSRDVLRELARF